MKLFNILAMCAVFIFSYSCKKNTSETNQITRSKVPCHAIKDVTEKYLEKYKSYFTPDNYTQKALETLSNVPEEYLEFVFTKNNVKVEIEGLNTTFYSPLHGKSVCGYTLIKQTGNNSRTVGNIKSNVECFLHEFALDSFAFFASKNTDFVKELTKLSYIIEQKYKIEVSSYLNTFSLSNSWRIDEVLAELFGTWYCSSSSRNRLKRDIPEAYDFARKFFLPPVDEDA